MELWAFSETKRQCMVNKIYKNTIAIAKACEPSQRPEKNTYPPIFFFSRFPKHTIFLFGPRDQLLLKPLDVLSL